MGAKIRKKNRPGSDEKSVSEGLQSKIKGASKAHSINYQRGGRDWVERKESWEIEGGPEYPLTKKIKKWGTPTTCLTGGTVTCIANP